MLSGIHRFLRELLRLIRVLRDILKRAVNMQQLRITLSGNLF